MKIRSLMPVTFLLAVVTVLQLSMASSGLAETEPNKSKLLAEKSQVFKEKKILQAEINKIVSQLRRDKHPELIAIEKKFFASINPINDAMEKHPDFAAIRKQRDDAQDAYMQAQKDKDTEAMKKARITKSKAVNALYKAAYAHKDVIPHIKAREAVGKEREEVKLKLASEKNAELVKKYRALDKRYREIRKLLAK